MISKLIFVLLAYLTCLASALPETWISTGTMSDSRYWHTETLLTNGKVLVVGGESTSILSSAALYDPDTGTWTNTGSMSQRRYGHTATLLTNGKVLVAGGYNGTILSSVELYDPATGTWTNSNPMMSLRTGHTATLLANGKVLVTGGEGGFTNIRSDAELYDPATGTWTSTGSMSNSRWIHRATLLANGKVLVTGGRQSYNTGALSSTTLYDPATGVWTNAGLMSSERVVHTATLLADGRVLVAGGKDSNNSVLSSADLYDPASGTWTNTGLMSVSRFEHTATLLADGRVLAAGGETNNSNILTSADLYNPTSGTWSNTSSMSGSRQRHSATLLTNGRVFVAGGANANGALSSAEIFNPVSTYTLTTQETTQGTITGNTSPYVVNTNATLNVTPNPGYLFIGWTGDASGTENPLTILMDGDKSIGATFVRDTAQAELVIEHPTGNSLTPSGVVDFGWIAVGATSSLKTFTVMNVGGAELNDLSVTVSSVAVGDFIIDADSLPMSLEPGESGVFHVSFLARSRGAVEATLEITSTDENVDAFSITLLGKGALDGNDDTIADGAFNIEFVPIGSPGNMPDDTGYGAVGYVYRISKHEVSRDMVNIYNSLSGNPEITIANLSERHFPATGVSWNEAARFVNWLNTSSGYEPAYKFTTSGSNDNAEPWTPSDGLAYDPYNPIRNPQSYYFLPSEDEWYKAAYFSPTANSGAGDYWDYATGDDTAPIPVSRSLLTGRAVYNGQATPALITHAGGVSPLGTMAQNGNAEEWCESLLNPPYLSSGQSRVIRGGAWSSNATMLISSERTGANTTSKLFSYGFRIASRESPEGPAPSPVTAANFLLDDYSDDRNFRAENYTFYNAFNDPFESWQLINGTLRVYPGGKKTAGYMWNAGHKLAAVGDSVSIRLFENTDGATGLQFDDDLVGPDGGSGVRFYRAQSGSSTSRYLFGPWGPSMPLSGAPSGAMLLEVTVVRVREASIDLRAKISGRGFAAIERDFTMPSTELYFGLHAYSAYLSNSYYNIFDNLSFSSQSPYWKWSEFHGLIPGVNDASDDDANGDGVVNALRFAFDESPYSNGLALGKAITAIHGIDEDRFLSLTIPVRTGITFSGTVPLQSNWIDGIRYELHGASDLTDPWELEILQVSSTGAVALPALRDIDGDGIPDWEYRTFRLAQPVRDNPKAFMRAAIHTR